MSAEGDRPNILWFCTDQQRFDTLGAYGNEFVDTPNLDRLAQSGVLFENCYSQSPVCTPSRASFLTGRYPRTTRCRQNGQAIPKDELLVTKTLADQGYVTGLAGKLHLAPNNPSYCKGGEERIEDGYFDFHWSHDSDDQWPTNEYHQWLREKGLDYGTEPTPQFEGVQFGMPEEGHQTTWCAQKAITFIESNASYDYPWLFSLNSFDPHHPFDPPRSYLEKYLDRLGEIPTPNYEEGELRDKPSFQRIDHRGAYGGSAGFDYEGMSVDDHRLTRAAYWSMVELIDRQFGRIMDVLERTGQLEDTLVIFTSDHGEMLGDHGLYLKGPYFYEPAVHVPLIVSWPERVEGERRSGALVELTDLAPTILEGLGLPLAEGIQGQSLWPLLAGESPLDEHRDSVYGEYYNAMPWHEDPAAQATMVYDGRYKLVQMHGLEEGELYDLGEDPGENRNLWEEKEYAEVKMECLSLLSDRMAWTVDPLPPRKAAW